MIEITSKCEHCKDAFKGIVMRVISGELQPNMAIVCPCNRIAFFIYEHREEEIMEETTKKKIGAVRGGSR